MTIGLIGILTFILSLFQLRVDWKQRAERHEQAARAYAASRAELRRVSQNETATQDISVALDRYFALGDQVIPIPENDFNRLKRQHLIKVAISLETSKHPAACLPLVRLKFWLKDTKESLREKM